MTRQSGVLEQEMVSDIPPTIPAFSWRGALSPLHLVPLSLPLLAVLFAPEAILDRSQTLRKFVELVQRALPYIDMDAHANSTVFPQAALLAHCLTVTVVPVLALVWIFQTTVNYEQLLARRRRLGRVSLRLHAAILFIGPPFVLAILYFFIGVPGDPSFGSGLTTRSRLGFALVSLLVTYPAGAVLGTQLLCFRIFIDTYLKRENQ
jgi:hypothetical protein